MNCSAAHQRLSGFIDRELPAPERRQVAAHVRECAECARLLRETQDALSLLHELPRQQPTGSVAAAVLDRLEVERRGASLQALFRPAWSARPLIVPSLFQGALVFVVVLSGALTLDRAVTPRDDSAATRGAWSAKLAPSGTEANPLFPSSGVAVPQLRARGQMPEPFLKWQGEEASVFLETVVARDGSVSAVTLIEGDSEEGRVLADALRRERFVPARVGGRPVAVSLYRLFSRMEVRGRT
jgi:anti-sigma factor RsiW